MRDVLKRGQPRLKLFVGKNAVLRDTAALASGKLPSAADDVLVFSYTFVHETFLSGEITASLWVETEGPGPVSCAVRLDAAIQLPCLTTVAPAALPAETNWPAERGLPGTRAARTRAVSLRILTAPIHLSAGEKLFLSLQLRSGLNGEGIGGVVHFGGNHPSHLVLALEKNAWAAA